MRIENQRQLFLTFVLLLFVFSALAACGEDSGQTSPPDETISCQTDEDCSNGQYCSEGGICITTAACETDDDCTADHQCQDGLCIPIATCQTDADCPAGEICNVANGQCMTVGIPDGDDNTDTDDTPAQQGCHTHSECPEGHMCDFQTNTCVPMNEEDGDEAADEDGDESQGGDDLSLLCEPCENDPECNLTAGSLANFCVPDLSGISYCAVDCSDDDTICPEGYNCRDVADNAGNIIGTQCQPDDGYCIGGVPSDGDVERGLGLCMACENDEDCGGNFDKCLEDSTGETYCGTDCSHGQNCTQDNTYCKRFSETVRQCWPIDNACEGGQVDMGCTGACEEASHIVACYDDALCLCVDGEKTPLDCEQDCLDRGFAGYRYCGWDAAVGETVCHCMADTPQPDGDYPDSPDLPPPDYCPGYSGSSYCCTNDDPCHYANDGFSCDCDGACAWDNSDCSGNGGDSCIFDDSCGPGEVCDWATDTCLYVLCQPCVSFSDCGSALDAECQNGFCATACDMPSDCPSGFRCDGFGFSYCVPESGSCDGGGNTGDCTGTCAFPSLFEPYCIDDALCTCEGFLSGTKFLTECEQICRNAGYAGSANDCGYNGDTFQESCACTDYPNDPDGDEEDPPIEDGDEEEPSVDGDEEEIVVEECTGACSGDVYTCFGDDLCVCEEGQFVLNDCAQICTDAGYDFFVECGYSQEHAHDLCFCDNEEAEGDGTCDRPFLIDAFPFTASNTISASALNYLDVRDCEGTFGESGAEHVYHFRPMANQSLTFTVTADFDAVLSVRLPCSNNPDQCLGVDETIEGGTETISITFNNNNDFYVSVDQYADVGGNYTLTVTEN